MAALQPSPMSQLLQTLGMTRQDLSERSDQMRQFLTEADSSSDSDDSQLSRPTTPENGRLYGAGTSLRRSGPGSRGKNASFPGIKSELTESALATRPMDAMEKVIERQSREKRARKGKEKEREIAAKMTSSSNQSLDSFLNSRIERRVQDATQAPLPTDLPPITPQKTGTYYRDHTHDSSSVRSRKIMAKAESPSPSLYRHSLSSSQAIQTPTRQKAESPVKANLPQYATSEMLYQHVRASSSAVYDVPSYAYAKSPLPASSPPPSSPLASSPIRPAFITAAVPAPALKSLPFTLPPGPYSSAKPEFSYAALVGQAILSSQENRLTLQDIYEFITIVYPHYKRGELTWMNSIRHVLSTTVCFRKIVRDRSAGRSLWAIWDEDLPCFEDGGFKRSLCADVVKAKWEAAASGTAPAKQRRPPRKRAAPKDTTDDSSRKKIKTDNGNLVLSNSAAGMFPGYTVPMGYMVPAQSGFSAQQQSYYASCVPQPQRSSIPSEIVFPPLPAVSGSYQSILEAPKTAQTSGESSEANNTETEQDAPSIQVKEEEADELADELIESSPYLRTSDLPPITSLSSPEAVPELVVDDHSSSSPLLLPSSDVLLTDDEEDEPENEGSQEEDIEFSPKKGKKDKPVFATNLDKPFALSGSSDDDKDVTGEHGSDYVSPFRKTSALGPAQFWREETARTISGDSLRPGITLLDYNDDDLPDHNKKPKKNKGKKKQSKVFPKDHFNLPPLPTSPTLARKSAMVRPCTPPRSLQTATSAIRTPLSFRGTADSPPTDYRGNFDRHLLSFPSPDASSGKIDVDDGTIDTENLRTPSRKRVISGTNASGGSSFPPVTPKKLVFPGAGLYDPSYRTPQAFGGIFGMSPFRATPGSRNAFFDPHGTGALLDEELNRIRALEESPQGMFGKDKKKLLYESPNPVDSSPTRWISW